MVFYVLDATNDDVDLGGGWTRNRDAGEFPKVIRAQRLFPEAAIDAVVMPRYFMAGPAATIPWSQCDGMVSE
jgi:hypothetical protein